MFLFTDISFFQQKIKKNYFSRSNGTCDIIGRAATTQIKSSEIFTNFLGIKHDLWIKIVVIFSNYIFFTGVNKVRDDRDKAKYINDFCDQCDFNELIVNCSQPDEYRWQVIARVLFIYAKLNPGQGICVSTKFNIFFSIIVKKHFFFHHFWIIKGYVQGMNELIGPIYFVFANDKPEWSEHSEADTFFCFTNLMSEIRDLYNSQLDLDRSSGIVHMMTRLNNLLLKMDNALYTQLNLNQSIKPHYYAFRYF